VRGKIAEIAREESRIEQAEQRDRLQQARLEEIRQVLEDFEVAQKLPPATMDKVTAIVEGWFEEARGIRNDMSTGAIPVEDGPTQLADARKKMSDKLGQILSDNALEDFRDRLRRMSPRGGF
jgi:hypothetical protein